MEEKFLSKLSPSTRALMCRQQNLKDLFLKTIWLLYIHMENHIHKIAALLLLIYFVSKASSSLSIGIWAKRFLRLQKIIIRCFKKMECKKKRIFLFVTFLIFCQAQAEGLKPFVSEALLCDYLSIVDTDCHTADWGQAQATFLAAQNDSNSIFHLIKILISKSMRFRRSVAYRFERLTLFILSIVVIVLFFTPLKNIRQRIVH